MCPHLLHVHRVSHSSLLKAISLLPSSSWEPSTGYLSLVVLSFLNEMLKIFSGLERAQQLRVCTALTEDLNPSTCVGSLTTTYISSFRYLLPSSDSSASIRVPATLHCSDHSFSETPFKCGHPSMGIVASHCSSNPYFPVSNNVKHFSCLLTPQISSSEKGQLNAKLKKRVPFVQDTT